MDTQTLLIIIAITALALIASLVITFRSQARRRSLHRRVEATVTQIQVEAGAVSSWWIVTAEWLDPQTGRIRTFRSHHLTFPPHHHIGERIVVNFDANEPRHYHMEL